MRKNKIGQRMAMPWKLDESKLSEEDKTLLEIVHFPKVLPSGKVVQKRIAKQKNLKSFGKKPVVNYTDIVYVTVPRAIALKQIGRYGELQQIANDLQDGRINLGSLPEGERNKVEQAAEIMAPRGREDYYIDGHNIEAELEMILSLFSVPKPTPSMEATKKEDEALIVADNKPMTGDVKNLPNALKKQAREMYENKQSAEEIAAELEVDVQRVIKYLKKLDEKNG